MTEGIGKALESVMKYQGPQETGGHGRHIFLNRHRRSIFSNLTMTPCIGMGPLSAKCGLVQNTVSWHLRKLSASGYVVGHVVGRATIFYPEGLILPQHIPLFHSLNHPGRGAVYRAVLHHPGLSQTEIAASVGESRQSAAKALAALDALGLTSALADGAHSRYYPTKLLRESAEGFYRHSKDFSEYIVKRCGQEGGGPPAIIKREIDRIVIEMGNVAERFAMDIGINPFLTCEIC